MAISVLSLAVNSMSSLSQQRAEEGVPMKPVDPVDVEHDVVAKTVFDASAVVRAGFIRKVYSILSLQLLLTTAMGATFMFVQPAQQFALSSPGVLTTSYMLPFGFLIALHCYKGRHPLNMWLLFGFTLCMSYTVGVVCAVYQATGQGIIVLQALVLTAAVFLSLTTYVHVTKKDFSWLGGALFAGLMILIVWSFMSMLFSSTFGGVNHTVFALIGALLFCGFILYDTSNLLHLYGPDDYVEASIALYLDIVNLFLYLLELLRAMQGGDN